MVMVTCVCVEFRVAVAYKDSSYLLTTEDGTTTRATCHLRPEDDDHTPSLRLVGVVQESQVSANVAVVGDMLHIFTKVCMEYYGFKDFLNAAHQCASNSKVMSSF